MTKRYLHRRQQNRKTEAMLKKRESRFQSHRAAHYTKIRRRLLISLMTEKEKTLSRHVQPILKQIENAHLAADCVGELRSADIRDYT